jgi:hypothetical protein
MLRLGGVAGGGAGNKKLTIVQSLRILDIGNIFREWKSLSRSEIALAQVRSMRGGDLEIQGFSSMDELDECMRHFHAILVSIFANASEAFVFLDTDARGSISVLKFKRGLMRLNLREMWACDIHCVKMNCRHYYDVNSESGRQSKEASARRHHYRIWNDSKVAAAMLLLDRRGDDGLLDLQEWNEMMDWSLVDVHVGDRKNLKGSLYTRIVDEQIVFLEKVELEYQSALLRRSSLFDLGRNFMMKEEWRKVARCSTDPTVFVQLNNYIEILKNLIQAREKKYIQTQNCITTTHQRVEEAMAAVRKTGHVWDTLDFQKFNSHLDIAIDAVRQAELDVQTLLENTALHLALRDSLELLRPQMMREINEEINRIERRNTYDLDDMPRVFSSLLALLLTLSDEERADLLLAPRLPHLRAPPLGGPKT